MKNGQFGISAGTTTLLLILICSFAAAFLVAVPEASAYPGPDEAEGIRDGMYVDLYTIVRGYYNEADHTEYINGYWYYSLAVYSPWVRDGDAETHWWTNKEDRGWGEYEGTWGYEWYYGMPEDTTTLYAVLRQDTLLNGVPLTYQTSPNPASITASQW